MNVKLLRILIALFVILVVIGVNSVIQTRAQLNSIETELHTGAFLHHRDLSGMLDSWYRLSSALYAISLDKSEINSDQFIVALDITHIQTGQFFANLPKTKIEGIFEIGEQIHQLLIGLDEFSRYPDRMSKTDAIAYHARLQEAITALTSSYLKESGEAFSTLTSQVGQMQSVRESLVQVTALVIFSLLGMATTLILQHHTITVLAKTQVELDKARRDADTSNKAKGEFLANMSHEIRTPMNAIIGMAYLALQTGLNTKQKDYVTKIQNASQTLLIIINDILSFSKVEAGKLELEKVEFTLESLEEKVTEINTLKIEEKGLELLFEASRDIPPFLIGDPLRLEQILLNLLSNAVKFTSKGEIIVKTEILNRTASQATLKFSVTDTGIGMSKEQCKKIFKPFSQADDSTTRKYGGTGLGLTICKQLVKLMGGDIWVESQENSGSSFFFTVSLGIAERLSEFSGQQFVDLSGKRALVVDDNAAAREILQKQLESFSFAVSQVSSGEEALAELRKSSGDQPYDLVLMDWKMMGMDGVEAVKHIREDPSISQIPSIIMVTAYNRDEINKEAENIDIDDILTKPIMPSMLLNAIADSMGYPTQTEEKRMASSSSLAEASHALSGARILVVEDNEVNQQVASELLEMVGISVTLANNGNEALKVLPLTEFDGVLMDIQMPVMDGYEATRHIRSDKGYQLLPIIAMTAHAMSGDREKCTAAGMTDYVTKPISPNDLFNTLIQWIQIPDARKLEQVAKIDEAKIDKGDRPSVEDEQVVLPDIPGLDIEAGLKCLAGNRCAYQRLLQKFRKNQYLVIMQAKQIIASGEHKEAHRLIHGLKGAAGNVGAKQLFDVAQQLERSLRYVDQDGIQQYLPLVEIEFNTLLEGLELYEKQIAVNSTHDQSVPDVNVVYDTREMRAQVAALAILLESGDANAVDETYQLIEALKGTTQQQHIEAVLALVNRYDFEAAFKKLKELELT